MSEQPTYQVPEGQLSLSGPVVRPDNSSLPIRGDLAHIALADQYLVASYVVPMGRVLASKADLLAAPREGSDVTAALAAGTRFEVLDCAGKWAWGCLGPQGPSGYVPLASLEPLPGA